MASAVVAVLSPVGFKTFFVPESELEGLVEESAVCLDDIVAFEGGGKLFKGILCDVGWTSTYCLVCFAELQIMMVNRAFDECESKTREHREHGFI